MRAMRSDLSHFSFGAVLAPAARSRLILPQSNIKIIPSQACDDLALPLMKVCTVEPLNVVQIGGHSIDISS